MKKDVMVTKNRHLLPPTWTSVRSYLTFNSSEIYDRLERMRVAWVNFRIGSLSHYSKLPLSMEKDARLSFGRSVVSAIDDLIPCWRPPDYQRVVEVLARCSVERHKRRFSAMTLHRYWVYAAVLTKAHRETLVHLGATFTDFCEKVMRQEYKRYCRDWYIANSADPAQPDSWDEINKDMKWSESIYDNQPSVCKGNILAFPGKVDPVEKRCYTSDSYGRGALQAVDEGSADALMQHVQASKAHSLQNDLELFQRRLLSLSNQARRAEQEGVEASVVAQLSHQVENLMVGVTALQNRMKLVSPIGGLPGKESKRLECAQNRRSEDGEENAKDCGSGGSGKADQAG